MQYYTITHAVDTKETGRAFPQAIFKNPKKLEPNPFLTANKATDGSYPPDNNFPYDYLELNKGAKLTDLMSGPFMNGFLISEKLKLIFEESTIKDYKIYDVILFNKKEEVKGYYYFHSASCLRNYIDYEKSKFFVGLLSDVPKYDLPIVNSYNDLVELKKGIDFGDLIVAKELYLNHQFPYQLDFFRLYAFNYDFFISQKLKTKIVSNNITGVNITTANDLIKTPNLA